VSRMRRGPAAVPMPGRHIALLRGINVGRAKRVPMADLRTLMEGLGFVAVRTLLNSGNVVFGVPTTFAGDIATSIERGLTRELGVSARVIVLKDAELIAIVSENPLREIATDPSRLLVSIGDPADRAGLAELSRRDWTPEAMALGARASYLWCPGGIVRSPLALAVGRVTGDRATARNWATIMKLHRLSGPAD
jgi:uncharacterized protein (DUF1697 family)